MSPSSTPSFLHRLESFLTGHHAVLPRLRLSLTTTLFQLLLQLPTQLSTPLLSSLQSPPSPFFVEKNTKMMTSAPGFEGRWIAFGLNPALDWESIITNPEEKWTVILFFHAGGWVVGDELTHHAYLSSLLHTLRRHHGPNTAILSLKYSLASPTSTSRPAQFPTQLVEGLAAYAYLSHTARIPPSRLLIAGAGSGGALAASLALVLCDPERDHVLPTPSALLLFSPWVSLSLAQMGPEQQQTASTSESSSSQREREREPDSSSHVRNATTDVFTPVFLADSVEAYMPTNAKRSYRSEPRLAADEHLALLPPTYISVGEREVIRDDILAFAQRLRSPSVGNKATGSVEVHTDTYEGAGWWDIALDPTASWGIAQGDGESGAERAGKWAAGVLRGDGLNGNARVREYVYGEGMVEGGYDLGERRGGMGGGGVVGLGSMSGALRRGEYKKLGKVELGEVVS
ncbi:hypothetical protein YB2330_006439 [Saitoella coloradoensis]